MVNVIFGSSACADDVAWMSGSPFFSSLVSRRPSLRAKNAAEANSSAPTSPSNRLLVASRLTRPSPRSSRYVKESKSSSILRAVGINNFISYSWTVRRYRGPIVTVESTLFLSKSSNQFHYYYSLGMSRTYVLIGFIGKQILIFCHRL